MTAAHRLVGEDKIALQYSREILFVHCGSVVGRVLCTQKFPRSQIQSLTPPSKSRGKSLFCNSGEPLPVCVDEVNLDGGRGLLSRRQVAMIPK